MSTPYVVVVLEREPCQVGGAYGPFDEAEAGAVCASAIQKGANPGDLQVVALQGFTTDSTFRVTS